MKATIVLIALLSASLPALSDAPPADAASLPALGAVHDVTVSGLSSGAYMATQFHIAHASRVTGAGLIAGGPWGCAEGRLMQALGACVKGGGIDVARLQARARELASTNAIDATEHLAGDRVYLFHGTKDHAVSRDVVVAAADWYAGMGERVDVRLDDTLDAAHGLPTVGSGAPCGEFRAPYINACNFDVAGALLRHLYDTLRAPVTASGELLEFRQEAPASAGLADVGYAYVPSLCARDGQCRVHVFFHGCGQSVQQIGTKLIEHAGFNGWAEANGLVVLYPQVKPSRLAPQNPLACWDWWGYSGDNYLTRDGAQIAAINAMIERLSSDPVSRH